MSNDDFTKSVFSFIENTYGSDMLTAVNTRTNKIVVDRVLKDSAKRGYTDEKTGNKIIAMLRLNP